MITAEDLTLRRGSRRVVDAVDVALPAGRVTVAVGPNGAGKSSLLKLLTGEIRPERGRVAYGGTAIAGWSPPALARRRAVLPQATALAFPFTVHEIVRLGAVASGLPQPDRGAEVALAQVGLADFGDRLYQHLSGGEQQRVQFARALAQVPQPVVAGEPRALFLDEPTASLDLRHQIGLLETARDFARAGGVVFAVLHDLNLAAEFADTVIVMEAGRVIATGAPQAPLIDRMVSEVYGIRGAVARLPRPGMAFVLPQARTAMR